MMIRGSSLYFAFVFAFQFLVSSTIGADEALNNLSVENQQVNTLRVNSDRDPTAPSPQILARLKNTTPIATTAIASSLLEPAKPIVPEFRLKAMVLQDEDHGRAIISVNNRNVILQLSRSHYFVGVGNYPAPSPGFSVNGTHFSLRDFSDRSVTLKSSTDNAIIVVQ